MYKKPTPKNMKTYLIKLTLAAGVASCLFSSCVTLSYTPKVSLDVSERTVKKAVVVEKLTDISPVEDRENPVGGSSATNPKALPGDLSVDVTNAIVSDFATNGVFSQISRRLDNPDYILKGEIKKFMGKSRPTAYYWGSAVAYGVGIAAIRNNPDPSVLVLAVLPMAGLLFGIPARRNVADIEIELKLYDKAGNLLSTYTGKGQENKAMSIYNNATLALPSQTNKAFSQAIAQIRQQILSDPKLN
ncbi:MAG: hypothetical protein EAZ80_01040 [Runella slithyformis]|nr:MAG: hypothetical protein EAZ80_01040 [Runella slithyformis]